MLVPPSFKLVLQVHIQIRWSVGLRLASLMQLAYWESLISCRVDDWWTNSNQSWNGPAGWLSKPRKGRESSPVCFWNRILWNLDVWCVGENCHWLDLAELGHHYGMLTNALWVNGSYFIGTTIFNLFEGIFLAWCRFIVQVGVIVQSNEVHLLALILKLKPSRNRFCTTLEMLSTGPHSWAVFCFGDC